MNFTNAMKVGQFDFSVYELPEIRAAIKIAMDWSMTGAHLLNERARFLADILRKDKLCPLAIMYVTQTQHLSVRIVTPFNVQGLLAEKYASYACDEQKMVVEKVSIPVVVGFVNYTGKDKVLENLLPGVKVVPFDAPFALNVSNVAAMTKYVAEKGQGSVVAIVPPVSLYPGAPENGAALAATFMPNVGGTSSIGGLEWAHMLYQKFYADRKPFMETVATFLMLPKYVITGNPPLWTKLYKGETWGADKPKTDIQRLECLMRMQAYRSKDNTGISALTYATYGQEFGSNYRLAEKMGNFEIFLKALPLNTKGKYVRYMSKDERELVSAQLLLKKYGYKLKHFYVRPLNDEKPEVSGFHDHKNEIVYDPKCITVPFSGALKEEKVQAYVTNNCMKVVDRVKKYAGAAIVGYRAHVLGMEGSVIGMATPHNAVGVMIMDSGKCTPSQVWTLIMTAGLARNTFLYHRKPLSWFLERISMMNVARKYRGDAESHFLDWTPLNAPIWYAFTKEMRKRTIAVLREFEIFGDVSDDISDMDLANLVTKAQVMPDVLTKLGSAAYEDKASYTDATKVAMGHVKQDEAPNDDSESGGDDLAALPGDDDVYDEPPRQNLNALLKLSGSGGFSAAVVEHVTMVTSVGESNLGLPQDPGKN